MNPATRAKNFLTQEGVGPQLLVVGVIMGGYFLSRKKVRRVVGAAQVDESYFTFDELIRTSKKGCGGNVPSFAESARLDALVNNTLNPLRHALGKAISVSSGFRNACVNEKVGGSESSQHTTGEAVDIKVAGMPSWQLAARIMELQQQGVLDYDQIIYYHPAEGGHVHVSYESSGSQRHSVLYKPSDAERAGRFANRLTTSGLYVSMTPQALTSTYGTQAWA